MIRVSLSDAIVTLTAVIIFPMAVVFESLTYGGSGGMALEFTI